MKPVIYDSESYEVPDWVSYAVRDKNSNVVLFFETKPELEYNSFWSCEFWVSKGLSYAPTSNSVTTYELVKV